MNPDVHLSVVSITISSLGIMHIISLSYNFVWLIQTIFLALVMFCKPQTATMEVLKFRLSVCSSPWLSEMAAPVPFIVFLCSRSTAICGILIHLYLLTWCWSRLTWNNLLILVLRYTCYTEKVHINRKKEQINRKQ